MSSSYSSLDWVLSHWAHFTVHRFICVYVCVFVFLLHMCCTTVRRWGVPGGIEAQSIILRIFLQCFDTVGWVIWPVKTRRYVVVIVKYVCCLLLLSNIHSCIVVCPSWITLGDLWPCSLCSVADSLIVDDLLYIAVITEQLAHCCVTNTWWVNVM